MKQPSRQFAILAFAFIFSVATSFIFIGRFKTKPPTATAQLSSASNPLSPATPASTTANEEQVKLRVQENFGKMPLYFIENKGQLDNQVSFYVQGSDKTLYFTPQGITYALTETKAPKQLPATSKPDSFMHPAAFKPEAVSEPQKRHVVKLDFIGANPNVQPKGEAPTEATFNYFKGKPEQWKTGLKTYSKIVYEELWPGIDLEYSGTVNQMKYQFVVKPGADPQQIQLAYRGASSVKLNAEGQLEVVTPAGGFQDDEPYAYQDMEGQQVEVKAAFALGKKDGKRTQYYGFEVGAYDQRKPLVLDPAVLVYSGYIGGFGDDRAYGIAVDAAGNAYVTGYTFSYSDQTSFPVTVGPDLTFNGGNGDVDAFVAKVRADGTGLVYCGYIGGAGHDEANGIAVDAAGNAYVTGYTFSYSDQTSFPVTVGPDLTHNGGVDAFVAKVRADGTGLVYCGYIGGAGTDVATGIAVDAAGNAYVTGYTFSYSDQTSFPVTVGPDLTFNNNVGFNDDAFVAKVRADGTGLVYCGYIGGAGSDVANGIAVDAAGNAYVAGITYSDQTSFPVTVGPDLTHNYNVGVNFFRDAFVAKVRADGTGLIYCGYIGGSNGDEAYGIAVDAAGNAYVAGYTTSAQSSFPVKVGLDLTFNGHVDAFVAKVRADGTGLVYCGYIGGSSEDLAYGIAVDAAGNAYVAGFTDSNQASFPVTVGPGLTYKVNGDAFVAKISAFNPDCSSVAITTQPQNQSIQSGQTATLTVTATGTAPLSYQWYEGAKGDTSKPVGTNASSFMTAALTANKSYWVRVSNACGSDDSEAATVTIGGQCTSPGVSVESSALKDGIATLTATASGTSPYTFRWYQGESGDKTTLVRQAVTTSLKDSFKTPKLTQPTKYWVEVTNDCGNSKSQTIALTIPLPTPPVSVFGKWGFVNPLAEYNIFLEWTHLKANQENIVAYDIYVKTFDPDIEFPCSKFKIPFTKKCIPRPALNLLAWKKLRRVDAPNQFVIFNNVLTLAKDIGVVIGTGANVGLDFSVKAINVFGQESDYAEPFAFDLHNPGKFNLAPPPYPIVFVPGWYGSAETWVMTTKKLNTLFSWQEGGEIIYDSTNATVPIRNTGSIGKGNFYRVSFDDPNTTAKNEGNDSVTSLVNRLGAFVDFVLKTNNTDKVILVGHSAGGVVSRACLQANNKPCQGKVYRLLTYGSPHKGTVLSDAYGKTDEALNALRSALQIVRDTPAAKAVFLKSFTSEFPLYGTFLNNAKAEGFDLLLDAMIADLADFSNTIAPDQLALDLSPSSGILTTINSPCVLPQLPIKGEYVWIVGKWDKLAKILSSSLRIANHPLAASVVDSLKGTDLFITAISQNASDLCGKGRVIEREPFLHTDFTAKVAFGEGDDYIAVLKGLGYPVLSITPGSPIAVTAVAPDGTFVTPDFTSIPGVGFSMMGSLEIPLPLDGEYKVEVTKHPDADPSQTFSVEAETNEKKVMLLQDVSVNNIPTDGVKISPGGYEADVSPRPNGNGDGKVTIADWTQVGRFVIGLDLPQEGSEFQRVDSAPRNTLGDGKLTIADWVQAGRYAAGLDPVVAAGSFTAPIGAQPLQASRATSELAGNTRNIRIANTYFQRGQIGSLQVELDGQGNENAAAFSLNFDPKQVSFVDAILGNGANGAALQINKSQATNGRVGFALALPAGQQLAAGTRTLLTLRFIPNGGDGEVVTNINFSDQLLTREIVDAFATPIPQVSYAGGTVTIRGRAAANVSAASYVDAELAADSIASAFGTGLATMTAGAVSLPLPNTLGGTAVKVKDALGVERNAPLFFVSPSQINYQIPAGTADGIASVTITNGLGDVTAGLLNIGKVAPGLFAADASGKGWAAAEVVSVAGDGSQTLTQVARFDAGQNKFVAVPIDVSTTTAVLVLYGTGLRQRSDLANVKVKVGGVDVPVEFAGTQGTYIGLDQINVRLPKALLGRGEVVVELSVEGKAANPVRVQIK